MDTIYITIKITKKQSPELSTGVIVIFDVTNSVGVDSNIFIMENTINLLTKDMSSIYHHVAYMDELKSVPVDVTGTKEAFTRTSKCERGYTSLDKAEQSIVRVKKEIARLIAEIQMSEGWVSEETATIAADPVITIEEVTLDGAPIIQGG